MSVGLAAILFLSLRAKLLACHFKRNGKSRYFNLKKYTILECRILATPVYTRRYDNLRLEN